MDGLNFFNELGVATKLSAYTESYQGTAEKVAAALEARGWIALGERKDITPTDVREIIANSY